MEPTNTQKVLKTIEEKKGLTGNDLLKIHPEISRLELIKILDSLCRGGILIQEYTK
jgi:hypothetical protein